MDTLEIKYDLYDTEIYIDDECTLSFPNNIRNHVLEEILIYLKRSGALDVEEIIVTTSHVIAH